MNEHTEITGTAEVSSMNEARILTAVDRCERCGAQAFVITAHEASDMRWCAHHYAANETVLKPLVVLDIRHTINQSASISANI